MMESGKHRIVRLVLLFVVLIHCVFTVCRVNGFSMTRRYKLADQYPSIQQLQDLLDYEYSDERPDGAESVANPVKRQQNQGGTCTCTCETRPVEDEPAKPRPVQYPEAAGSLLRTGAGVRPQTASRVLERPQKPSTDSNNNNKNSPFGDYHSKVAKEQPWDFYGIEPSKTNNQMLNAAETEGKSAQEEPEIKPTIAPEVFSEGEQHDAWGHNRRFPWKHLPNTMCFRESCNKDSDCCMRYNLCDKSAKVCVDCWYGSICKTEQDCCQRFPYCKRPTKPPSPGGDVANGKCVSKE